eukprot:TRINITY_DN8369_c0_g1_i2.p1 TRINITY_DN8369_c0_g1~~TRINITY_DN8369_c0_g1_i2.p1  ORF type:complete len:302 (+),score=26.77 TRINITY_DN8369_c0_g1_i2:384-1289(+)
MFETDRIPSGWPQRLNRMDEIWVPTEFHRQVFQASGVSASKLVVVPESVDTAWFDPNRSDLQAMNLPLSPPFKTSHASAFKFLSIFKWEDRKGWKILLEAYVRQFSRQDQVVLYILTNAYHSTSDFHVAIDNFLNSLNVGKSSDDWPVIELLPSGIPTTQLPSLYKAVDCFVLPSRGEGWGRPHVEAMSMALPVITTNWSGPQAFITEQNSYPLRIIGLELVGSGPFADHMWALPDVHHLASLMQQVVSNPSEARVRGQNARKTMEEQFCLECVNQIVTANLARIQKKIISQKDVRNKDEL